MDGQAALTAYNNTQAHASVIDASPHKLITLLFESAHKRLAATKSAVKANDAAKRGEQTGKLIDIFSNLQADLDMEKGGEIAQRLDALYDYMTRQLLTANRTNDIKLVEEVDSLLREISTAWIANGPKVGQ